MSRSSQDSGESEMALRVNLDAMIHREDLDITDNEPAQITIGTQLKLAELEESSTVFQILRKPDFQRETANWTPDKIADLIENFLDGDLIPSLKVWRSNKSGKLFVIDGAYRLSALIGWINDDYGDPSAITSVIWGYGRRSPAKEDSNEDERSSNCAGWFVSASK